MAGLNDAKYTTPPPPPETPEESKFFQEVVALIGMHQRCLVHWVNELNHFFPLEPDHHWVLDGEGVRRAWRYE